MEKAVNPITGAPITAPQPEAPEKKVYLRPIPSNPQGINMVWPVIRPYVEEIAAQTRGEYSAANVYFELSSGLSHLVLGFADKEEKVFIGYYIYKITHNALHVWQACIMPQYRNTAIVDEAYAEIERDARGKVEYVTFSADRAAWHDACTRFGFAETFTIYRKKL